MTSNATNEPTWLSQCLFMFSSRSEPPGAEEMRSFYESAQDFTYEEVSPTGFTCTYKLGSDEGMVCRFWNAVYGAPAMLRLVQFWYTRLPQPISPEHAQAMQELMQRPAIMVVLPAMSDPEGEPLARMLANALKKMDGVWYGGGRLLNAEGDELMRAPSGSHDPALEIFQDLAQAAEHYVNNPVVELTQSLIKASDTYSESAKPSQPQE